MFKKAENKLKETLDREKRWVWVDGYKGTDKDMKCRDFQYEIGKVYDMPDDAEIKECYSGFHLCLDLEDVFSYYSIGLGRRFFKVRALVREEDVAEYRNPMMQNANRSYLLPSSLVRRDKLVAKSIEFVSELTIDEILADTKAADIPDKYKKLAMTIGVNNAIADWADDEQISNLIKLGYCEAFASYIVKNTKEYHTAYAVGMQKDLSMDMKVFAIMTNVYKHEERLFKPGYLMTAGLNNLNRI